MSTKIYYVIDSTEQKLVFSGEMWECCEFTENQHFIRFSNHFFEILDLVNNKKWLCTKK